jgi:hypothetical protein
MPTMQVGFNWISFFKRIVDSQTISRIGVINHTKIGIRDDWSVMSRKILMELLEDGGIFHLWGHSWEIEKKGEWGKLDSFLSEVSTCIKSGDIVQVTNGDLLNTVHG